VPANLNKSLADELINQQVSQLLVQIKNPKSPTKPKKTQWVGFLKNPGFSEPWSRRSWQSRDLGFDLETEKLWSWSRTTWSWFYFEVPSSQSCATQNLLAKPL